MPPRKKTTVADRYRQGVRLMMAHRQLDNLKAAAEFLRINYMSLYKIMDGNQNPTVEQVATLCARCKYNGTWLLTGEGEASQQHQAELTEVLKEMRLLQVHLATVNSTVNKKRNG